ncbi:HEAT repeat domain-containing protein [Paractinoplanes rishiriensis]|uniref:HEAT repeat domain-containing protein n=1 Tax=Paractinoplanes rishiriensis TaxID=1050105 RepID=UPI001944BC13|nr:HEAT repeat domain-containing protein [Actinoplanes rishiriensis]
MSSTYQDLVEYRQEVRTVLQRMGLIDVAMETYTAGENRPLDKCLADVRSCDLYIGVLAWRYGFVPAGHSASITELEYRAAGEAGIPRLMFVLNDKAPWSPALMDLAEGNSRISAFRAAAGDAHICDSFASREELRAKVAEAVARQLSSNGAGTSMAHAAGWHDYCRRLVQEYRRLDLDALTPVDRDEHLQVALQDVFVEPDLRENAPVVELPKELRRRLEKAAEQDRPELSRRLDRHLIELARESHQSKPAQPAFEALAAPINRVCVVLGDPGAGKSTLARYLVLALAEGRTTGALAPLHGWRPVLIELRDYALKAASLETFSEYLEHRGRVDGLGLDHAAADSYLSGDGRALVVFDGLDEIFDPRLRESIARRIAGFANRYPKIKVIVTSRVIGYRARVLRDAGFIHFTVQELTSAKIDSFLTSWYELALPGRADAAGLRRKRLAKAITDSSAIRELAGNPLLLTILAIIGKHQELPRERWKVYDHAAGVLVQHWDINKHLNDERMDADTIREDDKKELLRRLAIRMQEGAHGAAGNHLTETDLRTDIQSYLQERFEYDAATASRITTVLVARLRERNFILARYGPGVYGFVHRAMLDYFAAAEVVNRFEKSRVLSEAGLQADVFGARQEDPSWVEVLRLIIGMLDASVASEILEGLLAATRGTRSAALDERPPAVVGLVAQCIAEIRNVNAARGAAEQTIDAIISMLRLPTRSFGKDSRADVLAKAVLPAVQSVTAWPGRDRYLHWFTAVGRTTVWQPAAKLGAQLLAALFPRDDSIRLILHELTRSVINDQREGALRGLCLSWKDHPETKAVVAASIRDPDDGVRATALGLLTDNWPADETTTAAVEWAMTDHDAPVRAAAVTALAQHAAKDSGTHRRVLHAAGLDPADAVRLAAVTALATHWPAEPDTFEFLLQAGDDPWWEVRRAALRAVGQRFAAEARVHDLATRGARDGDEDVRKAAVDLLASRWPDDPQSVPLVVNAARDTDPGVRTAALSAMVTRWTEDPRVAEALDRLTGDHDGQVRVAALTMRYDSYEDLDRYARVLSRMATTDISTHVRQAALEALFKEAGAAAADVVETALRDPEPAVRGAALRGLSSDLSFLSRLQPIVFSLCTDLDSSVRQQAVETAARFWGAVGRMPAILRRHARSGRWQDRRSALEALATLLPDDAETLNLVTSGLRDTEGTVRRTAMEIAAALGMLSDDDLKVRLGDPDAFCRETAAEHYHASHAAQPDRPSDGAANRAIQLRQLHLSAPESPETLDALRSATRDRNADVRLVAVEALLAGRPRAETRGLAIAAAHDDDGSIRQLGLRRLLVNHPTDRATGVARRHALRDSVDRLRQLALTSLLLVAPDARFTRQNLALAVRDGAWSVRKVALDTVARRSEADDPPDGVVAALSHPLADVREAAHKVSRAAWPGSSGVRTNTRQGLQDQDPTVRESALHSVALATPDDPATAVAIGRAAADESTAVSLAAYQLRRSDATPALRHPQTGARHAALVRVVLDSPGGSVPPAVWSGITDAVYAIRAVTASRLLLGAEVVPLQNLLLPLTARHPDGNVRETALRLLTARCPDDDLTRAALHRAIRDHDASVRLTALTTLAALAPHDIATHSAAISALSDPRDDVRTEAVRIVATYWPDEPSTFTLVLRACDDRDESVRSIALRALVTAHPRDPRTAAVLHRATADMHRAMRDTAAAAITRLPVHLSAAAEQATPDAYRRRSARYATLTSSVHRNEVLEICDDPDWDIRQAAIYCLAYRWPGHPDTEAVLDRAVGHPDPDTRWRGYTEILRYAPGTPGSLRRAEAEARDHDSWIRIEALRKLASFAGEECTRATMHELTGDPDSRVRAVATSLLAIKHPADPANDPAVAPGACSSWSYLGEIAFHLSVRAWGDRPADRDALIAADTTGSVPAAVLLASLWADDPAVAEILRRRKGSEHHVVRLTALHGLARCWPDDPATRRAVTAGAEDPCPGVRSVALNALVRIGDATGIERVRAAMRDGDDVVASDALEFAAVTGAPEAGQMQLLDLLTTAPGDLLEILAVNVVSSRMHAVATGREAVIARLDTIGYKDARTRLWLDNALRMALPDGGEG